MRYNIRYVKAGTLRPFAGRAFLWFIRIDDVYYRCDDGLLEHEKQHVRQFWNRPFAHSLMYQFNAQYRYDCELKAYRVQLGYSAERARSAELFAAFILSRYRLDKLQLTLSEVKKELMQ